MTLRSLVTWLFWPTAPRWSASFSVTLRWLGTWRLWPGQGSGSLTCQTARWRETWEHWILPQLFQVRLSNTRITGDVAVLGTWPRIQEVDLSYSEVTGAFHVNSVFDYLLILKLTGTRTKIDFMGGRGDRECPFPEMTTLEVSGLAMDASVSEFLAPLLRCQHLNRIGAAGCGLTGELPKTALFLGQECPFDVTFLGKALGFLDLASNPIDKVDSIPRTLNSLVLAGNRNISFAEGVLQKAVQDGILLDMQNATFTNQTDACRCMVCFDCKIMWTAVNI